MEIRHYPTIYVETTNEEMEKLHEELLEMYVPDGSSVITVYVLDLPEGNPLVDRIIQYAKENMLGGTTEVQIFLDSEEYDLVDDDEWLYNFENEDEEDEDPYANSDLELIDE